MTLHILSAGAARGVVKALRPLFLARTGSDVQGSFGAVGAMREKLLAGEPCDVIILTATMIAELGETGRVRPDTAAPLGRVLTGIAVRRGDPKPDIASREALRACLAGADAIYFPDPERATAGIHFADVLRRLGLYDEARPRFRTFPNGAAAMRELAETTAARPVGCTQASEIAYTEGVELVGPLPAEFELATVYSIAVSRDARDPDLARGFAELVAGAESRAARTAGGFETRATSSG
jgi:molybdate transport system substrate-binding protein